jgi:ABC-type transporter Mla subunit MlaD
VPQTVGGNGAGMRLPFPGPTAVLGGAAAAADAVETALGLVPRAAQAMDRLEQLLDRADAIATRADEVAARAEEATVRTHAILDTAEIVTRDVGRTVDGASGVLDRVDHSLGSWEPTLRKLAPAAKRFADELDESEVTAAITLVDRMPTLLDHVENDVLPMMRNLDRVGPDLHEVLEVVQDLRRVITGLPGMGLLRRRGDEEPPPVEGSLHDD